MLLSIVKDQGDRWFAAKVSERNVSRTRAFSYGARAILDPQPAYAGHARGIVQMGQ